MAIPIIHYLSKQYFYEDVEFHDPLARSFIFFITKKAFNLFLYFNSCMHSL